MTSPMFVLAALLVIAGLALALERTRPGAVLTGAVIAILLAIAAANLGLIPHSSVVYDAVFTYLVPALLPLFLFKADLRRIIGEAGRMALAFALACLGTVAGVIVALLVLDLSALAPAAGIADSQREAAIGGLFIATYTGGSVNYAALAEITGLGRDGSFFSAATAADNLFSAVFLGLLALLPGFRWLLLRFTQHPEEAPASGAQAQAAPVTALTLIGALALSFAMVVGADLLVLYLDASGWRYVFITVLALAFATGAPRQARALHGSFELGVGLSFVFFAAIAAGADLRAMIAVAPMLLVLITILLVVHLSVLLSLGRWFGLTLPELIIASNAAVLGATTAPALAAARGWHSLVTPGVLVGVLGYAVGTVLGTVFFRFW